MSPSVLCEVLDRKNIEGTVILGGRIGAWSPTSHNVALHIIELFEEFNPLDAGLAQEMFDPFFLSQFLFLGEETL